jgi:hypothetical protein
MFLCGEWLKLIQRMVESVLKSINNIVYYVMLIFLNSVDQAEIDGGRGMAVMLFHVEGNLECLVVYQT